MKALVNSDLTFNPPAEKYVGKVRDVYHLPNHKLVMVITDRISAFDVVLPKGIPYKGQVLNQIADRFLDATADIVPNWKTATPDPMAMVGVNARPLKVEMVIRAHLTGHAWREYQAGSRNLCGNPLPEGLKENEPFNNAIITPTTKADHGEHDADISKEEVIKKGLVSAADYEVLETYTRRLFERGREMALEQGLILVDTKYEFGKNEKGEIILIDEIHTPDSSRYFYEDEFDERFARNLPQKQLSKEFVRRWLIENGFQGKHGQEIPELTDKYIQAVSDRYIELYEKITGSTFQRTENDHINERIEKNVREYFDLEFPG